MFPGNFSIDRISDEPKDLSELLETVDTYLTLPVSRETPPKFTIVHGRGTQIKDIVMSRKTPDWLTFKNYQDKQQLFKDKHLNLQDSHPASLLTKILATTESIDDVMKIVDTFNSDAFAEQQDNYSEIFDTTQCARIVGIMKMQVGERMVDEVVKNSEEADTLTEALFARLVDENQADKMKILFPYIERAFTQRLADASPEEVNNAASLFWALEQADLLLDEREEHSILGNTKITTKLPFAEILLHHLGTSQADVSPKIERGSVWRAKLFTQKILENYASDPDRHYDNVQIVQGNLFPDPKRPHTMSRDNLIVLANGVTTSINNQPDVEEPLDLLDPNQPGIAAEAMYRVLSITSGPDVDPETYEAHRLQDKLYSTILGMMLERRHYAKKRNEEVTE